MKLNPHNSLFALDRPHEPGDPPRRWKCRYCGIVGLMDEVRKIACTHVYPPCEYCGQTPECSLTCPGMAAALGAPGVHVVGGTKSKLPKA